VKILFVAPYVPSLIRVRPYQLIRELSNTGHEISVLAVNLGRAEVQTGDLRQYCRSLEIVPISVAASLLSGVIAGLRGDPLQSAVCNAPVVDVQLRRLLAQERFDLVHIEHLRSARLVNVLPTEIPRLFDAVDSISLLLERTLHSSHSLRHRIIALLELRRTRAFESRMLPQFDRTIVTSSDDAAVLQRLAPSACLTVVANGVDQDYFYPLGEAREPATLVFSGKMSYHANETAVLHFVRDIFPLIRKVRSDARLWIVGSGPPKRVRELARDPAIIVTGHVPDLRPYVGKAGVAVCPMVVKVGIQNKLLEAMAMATPAVSSRIGAAGLAADAGRDLLVADSPVQFSEQVLELLHDPKRAASIGWAGHAYVQQHHSWARAAQTLETLYGEAVARRVRN
jgi:sugar transferase (PEP-CTERM/EpsH1 system associated)